MKKDMIKCDEVLIESDWNLKEHTGGSIWRQAISINRIRLEFKGISSLQRYHSRSVLIESDWNLKRSCMNVIYLYDSLY